MKNITIVTILGFILVSFLCCFVVHSYYRDQESKKLFASSVEDFRSRKAYFEDFVKRVEGDYTWLDSDKAKVSIRIPRGWEAFGGSFSAISIKSNDFVPSGGDIKKAPFPEAGCWIDFNVQIDKMKEGYVNLIQGILDSPDYFTDNKEQKVKIGNNYGVKTSVIKNDNPLVGEVVFLEIPKNNYTYKIDSYFFGKDRERCEKEFDDLLNSLVIK
ncbi:hypothetical protein M0R01_00580 [bacterium]|nr:hypothetical protein [bacterium]